MKNKFNMGDLLKDNVTGFSGVVMCITLYATGCIHYGLQSRQIKKGETPKDWQYFDQSQLTLVEKQAVTFDVPEDTVSGAFPNPPKH